MTSLAEARVRRFCWGLALTILAMGGLFPGECFGANPDQGRLEGGWVIRSWGTTAGLPQNSVNAIVQTRDGYLWLATRDGLARFDGVRFTAFGLADGLPSVEISTLLEDRRGTLWVGTSGGGLSRRVEDRFESVRAADRETAGDIINSLAEDDRGSLWIATAAGLKVWDSGRFVRNEAVAALEHASVRSLLRDRHGTMWIATTRQGLFKHEKGHLTAQPGPQGSNPQVNAYCLYEDRQGRLWAGVGNWTILCLDNGQWRSYGQADGLPFAYVNSLTEDGEGTLWAGSLDEGLYRFDGERFHALRKRDGLSADDIRALRADREGNLWVGTRTGGLNWLNRRKLRCYGVAQGLTNDFTRSVAETADGTLWVATSGGGLYRGGWNGFKAFIPGEPARFYAHPEAVLARGDGSVWWGGAYALLCWQEGKSLICYTNEPWVRNATISALCEDPQGGFWFGNSENTLVRFENGHFSVFPQRVGRGMITALACETNGVLWVGSAGGGLKRVRWGSDEIVSVSDGLLSPSIRTLYLDKEGRLWIGTAGGGLSRWQQGRVVTFTSAQGLGAANTVSQIVEDDYGNLWLGCNRGVVCVSKLELEAMAQGRIAFLHPRTYGINDGMPAEECSGGFCPAGFKTRSGLVGFSTVKGLVVLDPRNQDTNAAPPAALLEEVLINGRLHRLSPEPAGVTEDEFDNPVLPPLVIPPGAREVELHYTGISFASPEKINFRYRLEGLDPDWVEAGSRRAAYYQRIPPGDFVFRVAACSADGEWSPQTASLMITVRPFLWQTVWFRWGMGLILLGAVAGTLRRVERRRYRRRLAALETQHAIERERLRISKDMHDHIGGMLTQVSQLSDLGHTAAGQHSVAQGHFDRIGVQARGAVQALDEIIWATNPRNDNLPRFAEYVSRFADEFFENTSVRCWQEIPTTLPAVSLRSDLRHNVFLALREALNNALKHSGATELWLRLAVTGSQVSLEVEDNGSGFDPHQPSSTRNGLENMKTRLAECGGRMELSSSPGRGTRIRFVFPLEGPGGLPRV